MDGRRIELDLDLARVVATHLGAQPLLKLRDLRLVVVGELALHNERERHHVRSLADEGDSRRERRPRRRWWRWRGGSHISKAVVEEPRVAGAVSCAVVVRRVDSHYVAVRAQRNAVA